MSRILVESARDFGRRLALEGGQGLIGDEQLPPREADAGCIAEGDVHHKALPYERTEEVSP